MKPLLSTIAICLLSLLSYGQTIQNKEDVDRIAYKTDHHSNLKDYVIRPNLFTNNGQNIPGKFSYKFIYDVTNYLLVKIEITDTERKETQFFYFSNDQLVLVGLEKKKEYFYDSDFEIPYWGAATDKSTEKRDKLKETAYRLLIRYKKDIVTRI